MSKCRYCAPVVESPEGSRSLLAGCPLFDASVSSRCFLEGGTLLLSQSPTPPSALELPLRIFIAQSVLLFVPIHITPLSVRGEG